jgi:hypothetical protein
MLQAPHLDRFSLRLDDGVGFLTDHSADGAVVLRQVEPCRWVVEPRARLYYVVNYWGTALSKGHVRRNCC